MFLIVTSLFFITNRFPFSSPFIIVFSPIIDIDLSIVIGSIVFFACNSVSFKYIMPFSFELSISAFNESNVVIGFVSEYKSVKFDSTALTLEIDNNIEKISNVKSSSNNSIFGLNFY